MPEFPIPSARILLVSQIQGGQLPSLPPVPYAYESIKQFIKAFSHNLIFYYEATVGHADLTKNVLSLKWKSEWVLGTAREVMMKLMRWDDRGVVMSRSIHIPVPVVPVYTCSIYRQVWLLQRWTCVIRSKPGRSCRFIHHVVVSCSWFQTAFVLSLCAPASRSVYSLDLLV